MIKNIDNGDLKTLFWQFFEQWLKLLATGKEKEAFDMLDDPAPSGLVWTAGKFLQGMREANNGKYANFTFSDIDLSEEKLEDCQSDTTVSELPDKKYLGQMYFPWKNMRTDILVLPFFFRITPEGFAVSLGDLDNFLFM